MYNGEKLSISGARKINFRIEQRDVYIQEGRVDNYHLFFEDIAADTFPIILLGNWNINEESFMLIGALSQKFQEYPNTCIFITLENSDIYYIDVYQKIETSDFPLINTEPVHSTTSLLWKKITNNETWRSDTKNLKLNITQKIKNTL